MVWLFKAKSYGFPKVEGDRGLWKPGGSWGFGSPRGWQRQKCGLNESGWHLTWVYMDIEEVLGYLRGELVGMSPSSCELTMAP